MSEDAVQVLLVEDDVEDAEFVGLALRKAKTRKYKIDWASRLQEAREFLSERTYDVVLCDLGLPETSGKETIRELRGEVGEAPLIAITGHADEELALEVMREGAQDYVIKGQFDTYALMRAIDYAIERRFAEQKVRESEERWRTLVENLPDVVATLDSDGRIEFMNRSLPGVDKEEALGTSIFDWVPEEQTAEIERLRKRVLEGCEAVTFEIMVEFTDGTRAWYSNRIGPIVRRNEVQGAVVIVSDVTARKMSEGTDVPGARPVVGPRGADVAKATILHTAAEELRSPMSPIRMQLRVLKQHVADEPDDEGRRAVDNLEKHIARITASVDNLERLGVLEEHRSPLPRSPLPLGTVVDDAVRSVRDVTARSGRELVTEPAPSVELVADRNQLAEAVSILVRRAMEEAAGAGAVRLVATTAKNEAIIEVSYPSRRMTAGELASYFDHGSANGSGQVGGLSMILCREIAAAHEADLVVRQEDGGLRTVLRMELPLDRPRLGQTA